MSNNLEKTFISSKNIVIAIIINVTIVALIIGSMIHIREEKWVLPLISLITISYLGSTFYNSKYIIKNGHLFIVSGFFKSRGYPVSGFNSFQKSRTLMAGSASGMERIEIDTHDGKKLIISPKNQEEFINLICKLNPGLIKK